VARIRGFEPVLYKHKKHPFATIQRPYRADEGSAGYDIFSPIKTVVEPNETTLIWTDVKVYMLKDEVLKLYPRSSMGKVDVTFTNGTGIIDSSYYNNPKNDGNIGILIKNNGDEPFFIEDGQEIGQGIFQKYLVADIDSVKNIMRYGGFGSSDSKK
jgi:dUTP pyrophosphatase